MMDSFTQILRRLPTGDASSSSGGATPFKVQINFDIPIFEGQMIQVDIGGHPPFPNGSKRLFGNFGNLLFLAVFSGPELPGPF
jgi:hypothetical protein